MWFSYVVVYAFVPFVSPQGGRTYFDKDGKYMPPSTSDSDVDYKTYTYVNRRYGNPLANNPQSPGGMQPGSGYQGPPLPYPGIPNIPPERYNPSWNPDRYNPLAYNPNYGNLDVHQGLPRPDDPRFDQAGNQLPGILAGWRADLQGRQRPDSPRQDTDREVIVTTAYGQVQGFRVYVYDNPSPGFRVFRGQVERVQGNVTVFLGIPYALPPTDQGRFKPPRPHPGWQQVLHAVDFGPACPQPNRYTGATKGIRDVHEDCLYLNVYTPATGSGLALKYPVMVYIHGGDFIHGASNLFPGHMMAAFYDVVIVTINYRLGALGFLSTGDANSPGNYGLLDQALAIRWIHENIGYFNGDRDSITLFGPDAGAASAGLLMVNPRTRSLIARVIAQSGSALAEWAFIEDRYRVQNTSKVFARHLGCSIDSSWKIVDCLSRHRSFSELGNANDFRPEVGLFPWAPTFDRDFTVPGDRWYEGWKSVDWSFANFTPKFEIQNRNLNRGLAYMAGVTTQEAAHLIYNNQSLAPYFEVTEEFFDQKIREFVLRYNYTINQDGIFRAIKYQYTYWPDPKNVTHIREQYIDLMSDFLYRAPVDHIIKLLVEQRVPVFFYVMNTTIEALNYPQWRKAPHDIEHLLLTGAPFMDKEFFPEKFQLDKESWTNNDRNMSHFFMKAYTDFARYGNPTPQQILGLHFEKAMHGWLKYLNLNTTYNSSILLNYRQTESAFWTWYLPTVVGIIIPTYPPFTEYWWQPKEPLQIAFWTMSGTNLLLIVVVVIFCILWRNAKRQQDRFYGTDMLMMGMGNEMETEMAGIENRTQSAGNIYEYRDLPIKHGRRPTSASTPASIRSSDGSLGPGNRDGYATSPNGRPKTPPIKRPISRKSIAGSTTSVPMTQV